MPQWCLVLLSHIFKFGTDKIDLIAIEVSIINVFYIGLSDKDASSQHVEAWYSRMEECSAVASHLGVAGNEFVHIVLKQLKEDTDVKVKSFHT